MNVKRLALSALRTLTEGYLVQWLNVTVSMGRRRDVTNDRGDLVATITLAATLSGDCVSSRILKPGDRIRVEDATFRILDVDLPRHWTGPGLAYHVHAVASYYDDPGVLIPAPA